MRLQWLTAVAAVVLLILPKLGNAQRTTAVSPLGQPLVATSMISVIASPERFHGQIISIAGYLHRRFEDSGLYFSKADADYLAAENALWVVFADKVHQFALSKAGVQAVPPHLDYFDSRYVGLAGTFDKDAHGHFGQYAGTLKSVFVITDLPQVYDGAREIRKRKR
jgi:hypothetical protein